MNEGKYKFIKRDMVQKKLYLGKKDLKLNEFNRLCWLQKFTSFDFLKNRIFLNEKFKYFRSFKF